MRLRSQLWQCCSRSCSLLVLHRRRSGGGGTPITVCGQVVTTNAFLTQNLHCPGSSGVVVGADGITIDLKGFRLRGNLINRGIDDNGFDGVTIRNGTYTTSTSVAAYLGADKFTVQNVVVSGSFDSGIVVTGNSAKIQSSNVSRNTSLGIFVIGDSATIQSVTASRNGVDGIEVNGNSASVKCRPATETASRASSSPATQRRSRRRPHPGTSSRASASKATPRRSGQPDGRKPLRRRRLRPLRVRHRGDRIYNCANWHEHRLGQRRLRRLQPCIALLNYCCCKS